MRVLRFLLEKEFKQLSRNPVIVGVVVFFMIMVLFFFPWTVTQELKELKVSIVNSDQGSYAERLIGKLEATDNIEITHLYNDYFSAKDDIDKGEATAIVIIPREFSQKLQLRETPEVQVLINAVDGTQAGLAQSFLQQLVLHYSDELRRDATGMSTEQLQPVEILPKYRYNCTLNYMHYMLPALLVIMLTMFSSIFPAMSIVQEKEIGTLQQLNVTPVKRYTLILSKIIPFWLLALVSVCICVPIIYWVYGLPFSGNFALYLLCVLVFSVALSFMGVILSNKAETMQQSMFLTLFFILIFYLMSGLFSPVGTMPTWAKVIAYINPLTYFIQLTRMIYLKSAGFMEILPDLLALVAFLIIFGIIAILTHNKRAN